MWTTGAETTKTARAPAKINWNLRVLRRRPDGYHEIASLATPVDFSDELAFALRNEPGITLACEAPDLPLDDRNLIVRAGKLLARAADSPELGATCRLHKQIPVGGGLGGGSSNAAATLIALNGLWRLNRTHAELLELGAQLGSDVPFFVHGRPAILRGRGEQLEPVEVDFSGHVVLLFPSFPMSTAAVYAACRLPGGAARPVEPPTRADARVWMERAFNDLEPAALALAPELGALLEAATRLAERPVRMSGSGSTLFTAFDTSAEAQAFCAAAQQQLGVAARVVRVISGSGDGAAEAEEAISGNHASR